MTDRLSRIFGWTLGLLSASLLLPGCDGPITFDDETTSGDGEGHDEEVSGDNGTDGGNDGGEGGEGGEGSLSAETVLTSTSLASTPDAGQDTPEEEEEVIGLQLTPDNVTGQVLSLLFATDGQDDEGVVIFGDSRPDIAPADADLIDFDFAEPEPILSTILLKPGFVGGQSSLMVLLFGYLDLHFTLDEQEKVVRVALADNDDMLRGDKLLLDVASDTFE